MVAPRSSSPCLPEDDMQRLFNEADFAGRLVKGELIAIILKDDHPSQPLAREPHCTRSQMVEYWTTNREMVALVHQYLRKDGSIGASGKPDPKVLVIGGVRYKRCH